MRWTILLIVLILAIPFCIAGDEWIFNSQYLILDVDLSSRVIIIPTGSNYYVDYVTAELSFFPMDTWRQELISSESTPESDIKDGKLFFRWDKPKSEVLNIDLKDRIKTKNDFIRVKSKVPFPVEDVPAEIKEYTEIQEIIDTSDDIEKLAQELASGEDDLFVVVNKIANWVSENIEYNMSTLNTEASQKASWVFQNKQGVCDELTSLFISLNRNLGIPARFVSGVAYTNSPLFKQEWGPHGWAEVYFPGYGWVPFDITYEELGFIDATHITSKYSLDAGQVGSRFVWVGKNIKVEAGDLNIDVEVGKEGGKLFSPLILLEVDVEKEKVGFGSYNLIEVKVRNLNDFYVSTYISISNTTRMEVLDDLKKNVLLKPRESKNIYWTVKVNEELDKNYIYTFPITVYSLRNVSSSDEFSSVYDAKVFSFEYMDGITQQKKEEEGKVYSSKINLSCEADKYECYYDEKPFIECTIKNLGNIMLKDLKICLDDDCKYKILGIAQEKKINFTVHRLETGLNELLVKASSPEISKSDTVKINVLDNPKINIAEIKTPAEVEYNDAFIVEFTLEKASLSNPQNVTVEISKGGLKERFEIEDMDDDKKYQLELTGKMLYAGENVFNINIAYEDKRGGTYETRGEMTVDLINVTFWQKVAIFFNRLVRRI